MITPVSIISLSRSLPSHVLPPNNPPKNAKFIWTFADPYEVVISVIRQQENKGIEWVKNHFDNLGGEFDKYDSIIDYDALHLEEHFDRWYDKQNFDLVTVKYRSLWDYQKELSNFVGSYIDLPVKNVRNRRFGSLDDDVQNRMIDTYGNLHEKVFSADEFRKF